MIEQINLIPEEIQRMKRAGRLKPLFVAMFVFYFTMLGIVFFFQKTDIKRRSVRLQDLQTQKAQVLLQNVQYKEVIERISLIQKQEEDLKKRLDVIRSLLEGRIFWSEILRNVTHVLPGAVWLTSLSTYDLPKGDGKGVKLNGTSLSNRGIAEFVFAMENSQYYGNVLLSYSQKREQQGRGLYDFELTADVKGTQR